MHESKRLTSFYLPQSPIDVYPAVIALMQVLVNDILDQLTIFPLKNGIMGITYPVSIG
jgi:hypothetical protein